MVVGVKDLPEKDGGKRAREVTMEFGRAAMRAGEGDTRW